MTEPARPAAPCAPARPEPAGPPPPSRRRTGLAGRTALVTTAVALVAVLITGLVSAGLVRGAAATEARTTLGRYADLIARAQSAGTALGPRLRVFLRDTGIQLGRVGPTGLVAGGAAVRALPPAVVQAAAAGQPVDETARFAGGDWFVEARPAGLGSVVLVQPTARAGDVTAPLRSRLLVALLVGLAVAVLAGVLLARRLARPLQGAAAAAHRLAAGDRDVRVTETGPAEVAEVARAVNTLAGALADSEGRQRQFLLSVSHELRTPLTAVRGYAEALSDGVVPPADVPGTGATMLAEADRLQRLVSDLLDLARLGAHDFRIDLTTVDLAELHAAAARVWTSRCAREKVEFRGEPPPGPLPVRTDPVRVRQVVDALCENALRVTPAGRPVVLAARTEGRAAVLEVRDGGPGLTDDDLRVAFERSALYDRYRGVRRVGTGVGLALVAGLAARLGGEAIAGHAPEGGARFAVRLPVAGPAGSRSPPAAGGRPVGQPAPRSPGWRPPGPDGPVASGQAHYPGPR